MTTEMQYVLRVALEADHNEICALAKQSKFTKHYSNRMMFSTSEAYNSGWIHVMVDTNNNGKIVAMYCIRVKKKTNAVKIYFITVDEKLRGKGVGDFLLNYIIDNFPDRRVELSVEHENTTAHQFYVNRGFVLAQVQKSKMIDMIRVPQWVKQQ
jgi:ribosomal protein S18 acetylase RimI-like enzyme